MSQALYRKWRPQLWDEIVGQQHVVTTLRNAVASGHLAHAYLFSGPRGTGKTTAARLLAKAANCLDADLAKRPCDVCENCKAVKANRFLDLIEIDAASQTGVEDVRDLRDKINFSPNLGRYKVYIIDEVHMFSTNAFNALLKTLEEPPPHAIFVLATTEIHKIPATVLSRCQRHEFRRVAVDEIVTQLQKITREEKIKAQPEALTMIARQATGSLRDAISLLDQLASTSGEITLDLTRAVLGTATSQTVIDLVDAIQQRQAGKGLEALHAAIDAGSDVRTLARQVVDHLRAMLLVQMGNVRQLDLGAEARSRLEAQAKSFSPAEVMRMVRSFNQAASEPRSTWQPALALEMALVECIEPTQAVPQSAAAPAVKKEAAAGALPRAAETAPTQNAEARDPRLDRVIAEWKKKISTAIKEDKAGGPNMAGLYNSCRVLDIKKDTLVLGFIGDLLCEKASKPEALQVLKSAIASALGMELAVKCIVSDAKKPMPAEIRADGMVAAAIKKGGEIVDIQD